MPVIYNETSIVPAPLVALSEPIYVTGDGTRIGQTYNITLHGTLLAVPPGEALDIEAALGDILNAQQALSSLFGVNGKTLEFYSPDGTGLKQCNPTVKNITFGEGTWVQKAEYTIELEAPSLFGDSSLPFFVQEASDNWQIEETGQSTQNGGSVVYPIWTLTHTISAKGRIRYNTDGTIQNAGWQEAKAWVLNQLTFSNISTKPFDTSGEVNLQASQGYNHTRVESVDITEGSFSLTETWLLAYGQYAVEDYTISVRNTPEEQQGLTTVVSVNGTVRGLSAILNDSSAKVANALSYFNSSVQPNLASRAGTAAPYTTLSPYGVTGTLDFNYTDGTVTYAYEYNDRPNAGGGTVYDNYTVSKKTDLSAYETTVTVAGVIQGRLLLGDPGANLLKFQRAQSYWNTLLGGSPNALLTRANQSGVVGLKPASTQGSVDYNFYDGSITYSYDFTDRPFSIAKNDYTTTFRFSKDEGRSIVSIEGTIQGLKNVDTDPYTVKYINALSFWSTWKPQLSSIATNVASSISLTPISLNPVASSYSRGDNPLNGTINYSYEFNTDIVPTIANALTQLITVNNVAPADVFAVIPVLGRPAGPILQNIGSKKEKQRTITVEAVMILGTGKPDVTSLVNANMPSGSQVFLDSDQETWVANNGHYTRAVTWVYE